jgi:TM2 domain-containing membrane protein YozV
LLIGVRTTTLTLGHVEWACSKCRRPTTQKVFVQKSRASVFFIPIFPLPSVHQLTCDTCGHTILAPKAVKAQFSGSPQMAGRPADPPSFRAPDVARSSLPSPVVRDSPKNPIVAVALSFLFPGLGHFYLGNARKGALLLGAEMASFLLMPVVIKFLLVPAIWVYGMVDAYKAAAATTRQSDVQSV